MGYLTAKKLRCTTQTTTQALRHTQCNKHSTVATARCLQQHHTQANPPTLAIKMLQLLLVLWRAVNGDNDGVLLAAPCPLQCINHLQIGSGEGAERRGLETACNETLPASLMQAPWQATSMSGWQR